MNIMNLAKRKVNIFSKNCRLMLSGEINILTRDIKRSIIMDDDLFLKVTATSRMISDKYPYIDVKANKDLHEITIKLFAINKLFYNSHFLEELRLSISNVVNRVLENENINVRVNISGNIKTWNNVEKFIYINNSNEIHYKVTETIDTSKTSKAIGRFVDRIILKLDAA